MDILSMPWLYADPDASDNNASDGTENNNGANVAHRDAMQLGGL